MREGFVGREYENPLVGFTIDLPPGWAVGESWPGSGRPLGWIAGPAPTDGSNVPMLRFHVGANYDYALETLQPDARRDISTLVVRGESAILYLAKPEAINDGPQVGIIYERIPGGPAGEDVPSLDIEGDSRGFSDQVLLSRVLTSVRYAEIARLPDLPDIGMTPGPDWQRVPARSDFPSFTIMIPPGWQTTDLQGIDTLVGRISGDGIVLQYDFGGYAGVPYEPHSQMREHRHDPPHVIWEERVGNKLFWLVRPVSPEQNPSAVTGVFAFLPVGATDRPRATMSVAAYGLDGDQQELVLAMLRTIELEAN